MDVSLTIWKEKEANKKGKKKGKLKIKDSTWSCGN
jgi:hypothetical protein